MDLREFTVLTGDFREIAEGFLERVSRMVWCNVATVDADCRPRSRVMHPIWEGRTGWIGTWATSTLSGHQAPSLKVRQLERNPHVSLSYIGDVQKPVYIDATAEVLTDVESKRRFTELARDPAALRV
jgi:general stress protein 26